MCGTPRNKTIANQSLTFLEVPFILLNSYSRIFLRIFFTNLCEQGFNATQLKKCLILSGERTNKTLPHFSAHAAGRKRIWFASGSGPLWQAAANQQSNSWRFLHSWRIMKLLLFLGLVIAASCASNVANGPKVTDKV